MTSHILTPREIEVVKWIVWGKTNKETAEALGVGVATVISHRKNIMKKLNTRSVSALTIYAVMHGIVSPEEI
jgi:DNA-binding CsgD family transcriptional regulator